VAVTHAGTDVRPIRTVYFVRLKLRVMANCLRGSGLRVVLFVMGCLFGVAGAVGGFAIFVGTAADGPHHIGLIVAAFAGTVTTLGWLLMPLLFFGVDETIDPARFALLPIPRRTLLRGMLAAAAVSIPVVATTVALAGLVVAGSIRGGVVPASVAVVGAVLAILVCVLGSRALTSAFASMLRSRKVRDLAAVLLVLLASSVGPAQLALLPILRTGNADEALRVSRILEWTPLAAPFTAHIDAAEGRWAAVAGKLAIAAVTAVLLATWWARTLEQAMIGTTASGRADRATSSDTPVTSLYPKVLRRWRPGLSSALVAREWRYWWRDPRRRANLVSLSIAGVVLPVAMSLGGRDGGGTPLPLSVTFGAVLGAMVLANQFGSDGSAYALHLAVGVPGRIELRARVVALAALMVPILVVTVSAVAVGVGATAQLPRALGTVAAALGTSAGAAALISVLVPYALPESSNPFAVSGNAGGLRGLLAFVGALVALVLTVPVLVLALTVGGTVAGWITLAVGIGWGAGGLLLGTYIGGDILDRRGPEILAAVSPRR
jgi:ABC-2 type transport system permease protein